MRQMYQFQMFVGHTMACGRLIGKAAVRITIKDILAAENIQNYTLQEATGCWQGGEETTTIVTIVEPCTFNSERFDLLVAKCNRIAARLASVLHQECVMLTQSNIGAAFVQPAEEN